MKAQLSAECSIGMIINVIIIINSPGSIIISTITFIIASELLLRVNFLLTIPVLNIVCLIYVERLMETAFVPLVSKTWRPCLLCGQIK